MNRIYLKPEVQVIRIKTHHLLGNSMLKEAKTDDIDVHTSGDGVSTSSAMSRHSNVWDEQEE